MNQREFNRCLQSIRDGNNRGMIKIYNYYFKRLKVSVAVEVRNEADAEDIASAVMESFLRNAKNYGYIEKPDAYMYRSAKNAVINFKKKNNRYVYTELIDEIYPAKDAKIDTIIICKQFLETLKERQREIMELHLIYGFKIKEIAKFLNISVSTVNRDLSSLQKEYSEFEKKSKIDDTF